MFKRTVIALGSAAIALWLATAWCASDELHDGQISPIRAVLMGLAITLTVSAVVLLATRMAIPEIVRTIDDARRRALRIPSQRAGWMPAAYVERNQVTMEIPRPKVTAGGRRQDYWNSFADVAETLLERREDDPDPDSI